MVEGSDEGRKGGGELKGFHERSQSLPVSEISFGADLVGNLDLRDSADVDVLVENRDSDVLAVERAKERREGKVE